MPTSVRYWYLAPGSTEAVEIATERHPDNEPEDALRLIDPVGATTTIRPDNQEEYGETKEVKVLEILPGAIEPGVTWEGKPSTPAPSWIAVVVTDPDA